MLFDLKIGIKKNNELNVVTKKTSNFTENTLIKNMFPTLYFSKNAFLKENKWTQNAKAEISF